MQRANPSGASPARHPRTVLLPGMSNHMGPASLKAGTASVGGFRGRRTRRTFQPLHGGGCVHDADILRGGRAFRAPGDDPCHPRLAGAAVGRGPLGAPDSLGPSHAVRGPTFLTFSGVSCLAATWCTAVGNYARIGGHFAGLVERLTGDTWTIEPSERPTGATDVRLASVSCTTPMNCVAVGNTQDGGEQRALAERLIANPINRFAVSDVHALRDGVITFRIRAPSDGRVDVLLTAWNDNLARTAVLEPTPGASCSRALRSP